MAKKSPVTICVPRHSPRREPKFHRILMLDGDGSVTTVLFMAESKGWVFIILIDIGFILGVMTPPKI
jgi:hypothetical protein